MFPKGSLTIAFSGYNIKKIALLAIESFLLYYPELRPNIIYFDDNSTDGTREELSKKGIKVISWTDDLKAQFDELVEKDFFTDGTQKLSSRVSFIMTDIMKQCETKYLLINDGDVIFHRGGFLELYYDSFKENKIMFEVQQSVYSALSTPKVSDEYAKELQYYLKNQYANSDASSIDGIKFSKEEIKSGIFYSLRAYFLHLVMDLDYFKSKNILGDRLTKSTLSIMNGGLVDTGTDFYLRIRDEKIPYRKISGRFINAILLHFSWLSSNKRKKLANVDSSNNVNARRNFKDDMLDVLSKPRISSILRKLNMTPHGLIESYLSESN